MSVDVYRPGSGRAERWSTSRLAAWLYARDVRKLGGDDTNAGLWTDAKLTYILSGYVEHVDGFTFAVSR